MAQAYVIKRLKDGRYYKSASKPAYNFRMTREELAAALDARHWTDDLQKARTYTNRGGAANALPYKADPKDYAFVPVKLVECEE